LDVAGGLRFCLRLRGVFLAHDGGEVHGFDLRGLIPGMAAARAFQSTALLAQQLGRDFKMRRAAWAGDAH